MLIKKITTGFVIQTFDTEKKKYIGQEFVAGDIVDYENERGEALDDEAMSPHDFGPDAESGPAGEAEPYLPFDMVQPYLPTPLETAIKLLYWHLHPGQSLLERGCLVTITEARAASETLKELSN